MKRLTIIVSILALSSMIAFSQNSAQKKSMEEVKKYIDKNVFPLVEKQQVKYLSKLSEDETSELKMIKEEASNQKPRSSDGKQMSTKGENSKNRLDKSRKGSLMAVTKITDAHPKLNVAYEETINKNKQIWVADIIAIHTQNNAQPMHSKDGKTGIEMFFTRMSSPEWLLLWDPTNPRMTHMKGSRTQNDFRQRKPPVGKRNSNPELRSEIKSYATENILPVIAQERKNFEKLLSANEKKIIETARQKIEVRKIMFKNWYESEDFESGKRAKDENFDGMRIDMQNSMTEVREIALAHNMEIRESITEIKSHLDKWKNEISVISENNNQDPEKTNRIIRQRMHKSQTPISFLLFNPDKTAEADLFGFDKEDKMKVILYPNPVYENGTIAIINAIDKNVQVTLFTKDGETLRTLYQGNNQKQRLEVMINVSELSNDIYLIKVVTENIEVVRKVVVKH